MAKKRGKKKTRRVKRISRTSRNSKKYFGKYDARVSLILKNLGFFVVLFLIFVGLYNVFDNEFMVNLFWSGALITGFISIALFIAYLVFFFLKLMNRR